MADEQALVPKATVVLPSGTKVTVEGAADDVAAMVALITDGSSRYRHPSGGTRKQRTATAAPGRVSRASKGPADHIRELVTTNFFKTKRGLGEVQKKLEEDAHIYPITSLSPALFRLVRTKELRRIKEAGAWRYVNP